MPVLAGRTLNQLPVPHLSTIQQCWRIPAPTSIGTNTDRLLLTHTESKIFAECRKGAAPDMYLLWSAITHSDINYMVRYTNTRTPFRCYKAHSPEISGIT